MPNPAASRARRSSERLRAGDFGAAIGGSSGSPAGGRVRSKGPAGQHLGSSRWHRARSRWPGRRCTQPSGTLSHRESRAGFGDAADTGEQVGDLGDPTTGQIDPVHVGDPIGIGDEEETGRRRETTAGWCVARLRTRAAGCIWPVATSINADGVVPDLSESCRSVVKRSVAKASVRPSGDQTGCRSAKAIVRQPTQLIGLEIVDEEVGQAAHQAGKGDPLRPSGDQLGLKTSSRLGRRMSRSIFSRPTL